MASPPKPPTAAAAKAAAQPDDGATTKAAEQASAAAEKAHAETDTPFEEKDVLAESVNAAGGDPLNGQAAAAVANVDFLVAAMSPAQSLAMLDAVMVQTLGLAMQNAVLRQQADRVVSAAVISAACGRMLEIAGLPPIIIPPPAPPPPLARVRPVPASATKPTVRKTPGGVKAAGSKTRKTA